MKVLSLEEIKRCVSLPSRDELDRLLHTAREYHRLREALEFYAAKDNWESLDSNRNTRNKVYDICLFDFSRDLEPKKDYAGKRAREALKEGEGE